MPYWMTNPDHGMMPVYSESEVAQAQANGWALLNHGESPITTEQVVREVLAESMRLDPPPKRKPGRPPKVK